MQIVVRLLVVLAAALVCMGRPALAQGTQGQVPEPVSTGDLHRYLDRYVKPTTAQWDAIESLHDDYREAFRQLRDTDIEKFLEETRKLQGAGMPKRQAIEEFMRKYERITKRVEDIDSSLMDGIAAIVGDEKAAEVQRVRDARVRDRELSMGMMAGFGSGGNVDVSALALDVLESDAARAPLQPTLTSYEQRLTSLARKMGDDSRNMMLDLFKEIEKLGYAEMSQEQLMEDPERMKELMEAMQNAWKTVGAKVQKDSSDIRELHGKTFRAISGQMQGDAVRRFRAQYISKMHPELAWTSQSTERLFRAALRMNKIDEDGRARIKAEYETWMKADDALVDQGMKLNDEFATSRNPMDFDGNSWQQHSEEIGKISGKRSELAEKAGEFLKSMIGEERFNKLNAHVMAKMGDDPMADTGDPEAGDAEAGISVAAQPSDDVEAMHAQWGIGAAAIDVAAVQGMVASLGLDDGTKAMLETLHGDYMKKWDDEIKPIVAAMTDAQQGMWVVQEEGKAAKIDAGKQSLYYEKQLSLVDRAAALDDEFFDDATRSTDERYAPGFKAARLQRALDSVGRMPTWGFWNASQEQPVNLARIINEAQLADEVLAKARAALLERADELIKMTRSARKEEIAAEQKTQEFNAKWQEKWQEGNVDTAEQVALSTEMMKNQQQMADIAARRGKTMGTAFDTVLAVLGEQDREMLQLSYDKTAYPSIYRDPRSAISMIEKASAMGDLTDAQRTQLKALSDAYSKEYFDACRRMVPKRKDVEAGARVEQQFADQMQVHSDRAKVQFERDERSARAVSQLRRILTEEQAKRIPGLADYEKSLKSEHSFPQYLAD